MDAVFASLAEVVRTGGELSRPVILKELSGVSKTASNPSSWNEQTLSAMAGSCKKSLFEVPDELAEPLAIAAAGVVILEHAVGELLSTLNGSRQSSAFGLVALKGEVDAAGALFAQAYQAAITEPKNEQSRLRSEALQRVLARCFERLAGFGCDLRSSATVGSGELAWIWGLTEAYSKLASGRTGSENTEFITKNMHII